MLGCASLGEWREPACERLVLFRDDALAVDVPPSSPRVLVGERVDAILVRFVGDDEDLDDTPTGAPPQRERVRVIRPRSLLEHVLDGIEWFRRVVKEQERQRKAAIARGLPCSPT